MNFSVLDSKSFVPRIFENEQSNALATLVRVPPTGQGPEDFKMGHLENPGKLIERYGRTESGYEDTKQRRADLRTPYFMFRFPITNLLFSRFVADRADAGQPFESTAEKVGKAWVLEGQKWRAVSGAYWRNLPEQLDDLEQWRLQPASCLSWHDANEFSRWLNEVTALDAFKLPGYGFRLPSEAEWEFACRAGTDTPYWWGVTLDDEHAVHRRGRFPTRQRAEPVEIAGKPGVGRCNPWGLSDMSGNVWEWCHDVYDPTRPERRVLRGGSWGSSSADGRMLSFFRGHMPADDLNDRNGFRLAYGITLADETVKGKL